MSLADDMAGLETVEDFLDFFDVSADARVIRVNRLHILSRFHDFLTEAGGVESLNETAGRDIARAALTRACDEFAGATAVELKVFRVHRMEDERKAAAFVSLDAIRGL